MPTTSPTCNAVGGVLRSLGMFKTSPIAAPGPGALVGVDLVAAAADVARAAESAAHAADDVAKDAARAEDTRLQFTVRAIAALANLRGLAGADAEGAADVDAESVAAARAALGARVAIFRAATVIEERFPLGPGDAPMALPLSNALRAYFEDGDSEGLFGARRWPQTLDTFFDSPTHVIVISPRGMFVLHEARVAAVYGLVDAALALVDRELRLSPERRAQIERRFRHWSSTAQPLLTDAAAAASAKIAPTEPAPAASTEAPVEPTIVDATPSPDAPTSVNIPIARVAAVAIGEHEDGAVVVVSGASASPPHVYAPVPAEPSPTTPEPITRKRGRGGASSKGGDDGSKAGNGSDSKVGNVAEAVSSSETPANDAATPATSAARKDDSHGSEEGTRREEGSREEGSEVGTAGAAAG